MAKATGLQIDGKHFVSIKDACKNFGLHESTVARRLRTGWTLEQAFNKAPKPARIAHNRRQLKTKFGKYSSLRDAAKATGIEETTIQARLARGWSVEQALEQTSKPLKENKGNEIYCEGVLFKSIAAFARAYGKNYIRIAKRLMRNWTPEQAVDIHPAPPRFRNHHGHARSHMWKEPTVIDGKLKMGAPAGSFRLYVIKNTKNNKEYVGITTNDLKARLRGHRRQAKKGTRSPLYNAMRKHGEKNFFIDLIRDDATGFVDLQNQEVAEIELRKTRINGYNTAAGGAIGTSKSIEIDGKTFPSQQAAAIYYLIDPAVFNLRLGRLGWSPEEAAEIKKRRFNRIKFEVDGRNFKSLKSAAEALGIEYKLAHDRYNKKKWSLREALGIDPPPRVASKPIDYKGEVYASIADFARAHRLEADTVSARLAKGDSLERSIRPAASGKGKLVRYNKKSYKSVAELARVYDVKAEQIYARLRKGMSLNQAMQELLKKP